MPAGRPLSENRIYADEIGVSLRVVVAHGGAQRLKALSESEREILVRPKGKSAPKTCLAKLGMVSRKPSGGTCNGSTATATMP